MHFQLTKYKFSYTRGVALDPDKGFAPGPHQALTMPMAGLDPIHGFLRFTLDVFPAKQFLKVGRPDIGPILCMYFSCLQHM